MGNILQELREALTSKCRPLDRTAHPAIFEAVSSLAKEAGIETPEIEAMDFRLPMAAAKPMTLGGRRKQSVVLSTSMIDSLKSEDPSTISREMKAAILHEFSHLKHHPKESLGTYLPFYLGPLVAIGAYKLIQYAVKKHKETQRPHEELINEAPANALTDDDDAPKSSNQEPAQEEHPYLKRLLGLAKYVAIGALGAGVGLLIGARHARHIEYRADAFSAKISKDPAAMQSVLQKLADAWVPVLKEQEISTYEFLGKNDDNAKLKGAVGKITEWAKNLLLMHPTVPDRVTRLSQMSL